LKPPTDVEHGIAAFTETSGYRRGILQFGILSRFEPKKSHFARNSPRLRRNCRLCARPLCRNARSGGLSEMKHFVLAGVLTLAALGMLSATSQSSANELVEVSVQPMTAAVDIARVKRVLHLTAEQEHYWPPVEAALRDIASRQAQAEPTGLVRRISHRVVSVVLNGAAVRRLVSAARPLIAVLRDDQKQGAMVLAQEMGLGPVLAALN
jgi:hypothetical protein